MIIDVLYIVKVEFVKGNLRPKHGLVDIRFYVK
jgi:hypothetical protein